MQIQWTDATTGEKKEITINPEHQAVDITTICSGNQSGFGQIKVIDGAEESGEVRVVRFTDKWEITGWLQNGAVINKKTYRVS